MGNPYDIGTHERAAKMPDEPNLVGVFPCQNDDCDSVVNKAFLDRGSHTLWIECHEGHVTTVKEVYA